MDKQTIEAVRKMIIKECDYFGIADICEEHGVTVDDFYEYVDAGRDALLKGAKD